MITFTKTIPTQWETNASHHSIEGRFNGFYTIIVSSYDNQGACNCGRQPLLTNVFQTLEEPENLKDYVLSQPPFNED